jgi:hypothetical protein
MKKVILSVAVVSALLAGTSSKAQLLEEQNITVTMDLQPILQLNMNGPTNLDFVFDQIAEYVGGITQYGASQLTVSSTVSWDLYAAGFSTNASSGTLIWDNPVVYGSDTDPLSTTSLPLTLLELHQDKVNPSTTGSGGTRPSYSDAYSTGSGNIGRNNIYATSVPYTRPNSTNKYIAGHAGSDAQVPGGTYLTGTSAAVGFSSNYAYTIDYRILPSLPVTFPQASDANTNGGNTANTGSLNSLGTGASSSNYAQPGVYTMNVKYVLIENGN